MKLRQGQFHCLFPIIITSHDRPSAVELHSHSSQSIHSRDSASLMLFLVITPNGTPHRKTIHDRGFLASMDSSHTAKAIVLKSFAHKVFQSKITICSHLWLSAIISNLPGCLALVECRRHSKPATSTAWTSRMCSSSQPLLWQCGH